MTTGRPLIEERAFDLDLEDGEARVGVRGGVLFVAEHLRELRTEADGEIFVQPRVDLSNGDATGRRFIPAVDGSAFAVVIHADVESIEYGCR